MNFNFDFKKIIPAALAAWALVITISLTLWWVYQVIMSVLS